MSIIHSSDDIIYNRLMDHIKIGQQWKKTDDGRIATISSIGRLAVNFTKLDNKGKMRLNGVNFNYFFAAFRLLD